MRNSPFSTVIYIIWINCWSLVFGMNVCMCHSALLQSSGHGVYSVWPLLTVSDPECLQHRIILDVLGCVDVGNKQLLAYCSIKYWHIDLLCSFYPGNLAVFHMQLLTGMLLSCVSILAPVRLQSFTGNTTVVFDAWKNLSNVLKRFSRICV